MDNETLVSITISIPKSSRDRLRRVVAQSNLDNLDEATSISRLGREIILAYLKSLNEEQAKGCSNDYTMSVTRKERR